MNIINIFVNIFFVNPFKLPFRSYDIWWESVDKPSIISNFPSTFCPTLGHHQGRMYITKVMQLLYVLYYFVRISIHTVVLGSSFFSNLFL